LDQQTVRAALKAFNVLVRGKMSVSSLQPSTRYLRLLKLDDHTQTQTQTPPKVTSTSLMDSSVLISLLEWRAAALVRDLASMSQKYSSAADTGALVGVNVSTLRNGNVDVEDATVYQRVSRAVTEAFVAGQVGEILAELETRGVEDEKQKLGSREIVVMRKVYTLVSFFWFWVSVSVLKSIHN
jgi:acyl-CoA oxidase